MRFHTIFGSFGSGLLFWATLYMPRYLIVSTQGIMWSEAVVIWLHSILWRRPLR